MKQRTVTYILQAEANSINALIQTEIKRELFSKKHNLSGEFSKEGGFYVFNTLSMVAVQPSLGPFVKLHVTVANSNREGTVCKLFLKRHNAMSYYIQLCFSAFFVVLTLGIAIYQLVLKSFAESTGFFLLPLFACFYLLIVEFLARSTVSGLVKRFERFMTKEGIVFKSVV